MARHRKLTQKFAGFPIFKVGTSGDTFPVTSPFTTGFTGYGDGLSLDLQFATDKTLTARKGPTPVFTRGSSGTFVGSDGLIQSAAINLPRFDHDPITLACKGLLIEESRTNLLTNSNFVGWSSGGSITVTPNSVDVGVAPDGSYPTKIECAVTGNFQLGIPVISGVTYNNSVYARSLSGGVNIRIGGIVSGVVSTFNTTNQFARYSHVNTAAATTTRFLLIAMNAGETIYVWGAQAEAGSFPTSYIPTTTASLARSADVCSITGTNFSNLWNTSGGTFLFEGFLISSTGINLRMLSSGGVRRWLYGNFPGSGTASESLALYDGTNTPTYFTNVRIAVKFKMAISVEALTCKASFNGSSISTVSHNGNLLTSVTLLGLFESASGFITGVKYYKKNLPNAKLQALTT